MVRALTIAVRHTALVAACVLVTAFAPSFAQPRFTRSADLTSAATIKAIEDTWAGGREDSFQGQRNVKIVFRVFVQPKPETERGAIVIVSGRTESMLKYKESIHDLWNRGYSIYIHDHRGQGLSDRDPDLRPEQRERGHVHKFTDYVDDLRQFTKEKVIPGKHQNLYLLAHSMGGAVTARFLESGAPEVQHFKAAVLSSPMLAIQSVGGLRARVSCKAVGAAAIFDATDPVGIGDGKYSAPEFRKNEYTGSEQRYKRLVEEVAANERIKLGAPTRGWLSESCAASKLARSDSDARKVKIPIRVMIAGGDSIVDNSGVIDFCDRLDPKAQPSGCGPQRRPLKIAGAKHELFIESDPMRDKALDFALAHFDRHRH